jgi:hypothetical protein
MDAVERRVPNDRSAAVAERDGLQPVVVFFPRRDFDTSTAGGRLQRREAALRVVQQPLRGVPLERRERDDRARRLRGRSAPEQVLGDGYHL